MAPCSRSATCWMLSGPPTYAIRRQPWEFEGEIALRSVTTLSLSFDHRLVDGEQGSRFLADIASILADPMNLVALA